MVVAYVAGVAGDEVDEDVFGGGGVVGAAVGPEIGALRVLGSAHDGEFEERALRMYMKGVLYHTNSI